MPRVSLNVQKRVSPCTLLGLASPPQPGLNEKQPSPPAPSQPHPHTSLVQESPTPSLTQPRTSLAQPSPTPVHPPQNSPPTSNFEPRHSLGSLGSHPPHAASSPSHSPSQDNGDMSRNNEEGNQSARSSDTRTLIAISSKGKVFVPRNPATESLMQIVYSHFDGAYSSWSKVPDGPLLAWWTSFKMG